MKYQSGTAIADGSEGFVDFRPFAHTMATIQIQDEHTYPLYVRVEYYFDDSDEYPTILFANWVRANSTYYNIPALAINYPFQSEKGRIRVNMLNESGATVTPQIIAIFSDHNTNVNTHYNAEEHRGIWAYDQMIERHTSAGVIDIDIVPAAGSWFELESMLITAGFSGAEDLTIEVQDSAGGCLYTLMEDSTTSGTFELPIRKRMEEDNTSTTEASVGSVQDVIRVQYPDRINILTSSVPATDDVLIRLRAKLKDQIPTITLGTNNQVQGGYTDDYSVVI